MPTEKIYIRIIDGTDVYVPINARKIRNNEYEILYDKEYECEETNYLFEFFSGDIVSLGQHRFADGKVGQIASQLIHRGQKLDREYWEFKFYATLGQISISKQTANKYRQEIERIKKEKSSGQFFYPTLLDIIDKLDGLIE